MTIGRDECICPLASVAHKRERNAKYHRSGGTPTLHDGDSHPAVSLADGYGDLQIKFAASSVLPVPWYLATCG